MDIIIFFIKRDNVRKLKQINFNNRTYKIFYHTKIMIYRLLLKSSLSYSLNGDIKTSIGGKNMFKNIFIFFDPVYILIHESLNSNIYTRSLHFKES